MVRYSRGGACSSLGAYRQMRYAEAGAWQYEAMLYGGSIVVWASGTLAGFCCPVVVGHSFITTVSAHDLASMCSLSHCRQQVLWHSVCALLPLQQHFTITKPAPPATIISDSSMHISMLPWRFIISFVRYVTVLNKPGCCFSPCCVNENFLCKYIAWALQCKAN